MPKDTNIEIPEDVKRRVRVVIALTGQTLKEASAQAFEAWLAEHETPDMRRVHRTVPAVRPAALVAA